MKQDVQSLNPKISGFEASCFDGRYITGDVSEKLLDALEAARVDSNIEATRKQLALNLASDD